MAADKDAKTEAPTPRRREEARKKGQVARSQDLAAATVLGAGLLALAAFGPRIWQSFLDIVRAALTVEEPAKSDDLAAFTGAIAVEIAWRLSPYLLIVFAAVFAVVYMQVGTLFTLQPLTPSLNKLNPINGIKRLFSTRMLMMAAGNVGKLIIVSFIIYLMFVESAAPILYACTLGFRDAFRLGSSLTFDLGIRLSCALFVLALLDFAWQKYKHEKDIRMTKEEVKDEYRTMEGDPKIKSRRRQIQLQMASQRLQKDVPKADVVVTNPTHFAVAIQYDADKMPAPKVVAKGADQLALRIRQIAADRGIPIVERKALARSMYETVEVGHYLPERFYQAIAEILAYVYELTGKSVSSSPTRLAGAH